MLSGNSLRQSVHTHCASVHQAAKLVAALLRVAGVTAGLAESNGNLPSGLWFTSPAGWLPRTGISSGTLRSVIEYGLPLPFYTGVSWRIRAGHSVRHQTLTWEGQMSAHALLHGCWAAYGPCRSAVSVHKGVAHSAAGVIANSSFSRPADILWRSCRIYCSASRKDSDRVLWRHGNTPSRSTPPETRDALQSHRTPVLLIFTIY